MKLAYTRKDVESAVFAVLESGAKSAVVFLPRRNPISKVQARAFGNPKKRRDCMVVLTIGRLNYEQREYVKLCKKAKTVPRNPWLKWFKS